MGAIVKILLGLILVIAGLWAILPSSWLEAYGTWGPGLWRELWLVIQGTVPVFIILIGLLLIWIESEELKTEKEFKRKKK